MNICDRTAEIECFFGKSPNKGIIVNLKNMQNASILYGDRIFLNKLVFPLSVAGMSG